MASLRRPGPLGDEIDGLLESGTLARARPTRPGVIESHALLADTRLHRTTSVAAQFWIAIDLTEGLPEPDTAAGDTGLVRIVDARALDHGNVRLSFESTPVRRDAVAKLVEHTESSAVLRAMSGLAGDALADWLTERLAAGDLKILWRRRAPLIIAEAAPAPPPPPAPRRMATAAPPAPAYTTFPPDFDALAVAESLRAAAQDGVPFCEECMKARSAAGGAPAGAN